MDDIGILPSPQEETSNLEPMSPQVKLGNAQEDLDIDDLYTKYKVCTSELQIVVN